MNYAKDFRIFHGNDVVEYIQAEDVGDEYHTITELYEHRHALFCALCNSLDKLTPLASQFRAWKSRYHNDGTMYDGWFIAGIDKRGIESRSSITYHLPLSLWDKFRIIELPRAPEFDGHSSSDVIERLYQL